MIDLTKIEPKEWLALNAKLQQKKSALRADLKKRGILKKGATNDYDHYSYFSEAQYKELFTELFSNHQLELKFSELEYQPFNGTGKQPFGRLTKLVFTLFDCETGFYEITTITGEGLDKGDKAGYKAYTGALKYYLANSFMVATGDDPEKESPSNEKTERMATDKQIQVISRSFQGERLFELLNNHGIESLDKLTMKQASEIISRMKG